MKYLVVVDMQNDFIDGALGTNEAVAIVDNVADKISSFDGTVVYTRDTHQADYLKTQEGSNLPVVHCVEGSEGWAISSKLPVADDAVMFDKVTFGSVGLGEFLREKNKEENIESITFVGLCTDICVISNAMLVKAFLPEVKLVVDSSCCAGVSVQSHNNALDAMKVCQIEVI